MNKRMPSGCPAWGRTLLRLVFCALFCGLTLAPIPAEPSLDLQGFARDGNPLDHVAQQWFARLDAVAGTWQAVETMTWFGRRLWLRQLALTQGMDEAAGQFTQAAPMLDRVMTGPDTLLLSGIAGSLHLVVQLQRSPHGLAGFASALEVSPSVPQAFGGASDPALDGLAQGTQVHASQWRLPDGGQVRQRIHAVPQAPDRLRQRLRTALAQQGWRETAAGAGDAQWQRGADVLLLMPERHGRGSLLYHAVITRGLP